MDTQSGTSIFMETLTDLDEEWYNDADIRALFAMDLPRDEDRLTAFLEIEQERYLKMRSLLLIETNLVRGKYNEIANAKWKEMCGRSFGSRLPFSFDAQRCEPLLFNEWYQPILLNLNNYMVELPLTGTSDQSDGRNVPVLYCRTCRGCFSFLQDADTAKFLNFQPRSGCEELRAKSAKLLRGCKCKIGEDIIQQRPSNDGTEDEMMDMLSGYF